jgi:large subunit ribosomal protein L10
MPNKKNIAIVESLQDKLGKTKSVVFANFKGLKVLQIQDLKRQVKKENAEFTVAKNTLLKISLKNLGYELPQNFDLREETGVLFSFGDEVAALKKLVAFAKNTNIPSLKFGFLSKSYMDINQVFALSKLPTYEVLIWKLMSSMNSSTNKMVYALNANIQKLTMVLENYKTKQELRNMSLRGA